MANGTGLEKGEIVSNGLKSEAAAKLACNDLASGKDESPSTNVISEVKGDEDANAIASNKVEAVKESVGEHGVSNPPTSSYYYPGPGYDYSFPADSTHMAMLSDNGSLLYYLPGYNPYGSGPVVGVDGQSVGQQPFYSTGYPQHPVSYGSEAVPCYSWDSTSVGDVPSGNGRSGNGKHGSIKSNVTNSVKSNGVNIKSSKSKGEGDGIPNNKMEADKESAGEHGNYNHPPSNYNYYYPGHDHCYFQADGSHMGVQSDNGQVVYLPDYNPYGTGVDGQSVGQQPYYFSSGYLQHPVSCGSEAVASWGGNGQSVNAKHGPVRSNSLNSIKSNGMNGKSSKSSYAQQIRSSNKVSHMGTDFSAGLLKGYHPVGNISSYSVHRQGSLSYHGYMNYRQNARLWYGNDRNRSRDKHYRAGDFENSTELTCGPRATNKSESLDSSVKEDLEVTGCKDQYNRPDFETEYTNAKFYVIKSYNEDDIHKSIKYNVWASTPNGNKKLDAAFREAEKLSNETGTKCPIFLFFSVNGSGQFVGMAEMVGLVDFDKDMDFWQLDKWSGFFPVKWHVVKDIPNSQLRHIMLENNEGKPVTFSRDTQEIGLKPGLEMLNIFKNYSAKASLLHDFNFYEKREKSLVQKGFKAASVRTENGDFPKQAKSGNESWIRKATADPSSLINLTKKLSLNDYSPKTNFSIQKPIENSISSVPPP